MWQALLILTFGTFIQSSSYVPLRKVRGWRWETCWIVQGLFAWILFPLAGALLQTRSLPALVSLYASHPIESLACVGFGFLWGVGGLTFGLAVRYLGISLGQTVAIGICSAFGSVLGPLVSGHGDLLTPSVLIGMSVMLLGVSVVMSAALRKTRLVTQEHSRTSIPEFDLKKGVAVVLLSGVMSSFFNVGLEFGAELSHLAVIFPVTFGGFLLNLAYCLIAGRRNRQPAEEGEAAAPAGNVLFCALTGAFWYSQFFGLSLTREMMASHPVFVTYSWCILMSLNILFTNLWGLLLREWKGVGRRTVALLTAGLCILVFSTFVPLLLS